MAIGQKFSNNVTGKIVLLVPVGYGEWADTYLLELTPGMTEELSHLPNNWDYQMLTIREGNDMEIIRMIASDKSDGANIDSNCAIVLRAQEGTAQIDTFTTAADVYAAVTADWFQSVNDALFPSGV